MPRTYRDNQPTRRPNVADDPRPPQRPLRDPAVEHLGNWLEAAAPHLSAKPIAATPVAGGGTTAFSGREVVLDMKGGSYRGLSEQALDELPTIRVTVGGRPLANAEIEIEVSDGVLENNGSVITAETDANGVASLSHWQLGAAPIQTISASYGSRRVERNIRVR
jgi:hypothetical protein